MIARLLRRVRGHMAQIILVSQENAPNIGELGEVNLQYGVCKWHMRGRNRFAARQSLSSVKLKHSNSANAVGANVRRADLRCRHPPRTAFHSYFLLDQAPLPARLTTKVVRPVALLARVK